MKKKERIPAALGAVLICFFLIFAGIVLLQASHQLPENPLESEVGVIQLVSDSLEGADAQVMDALEALAEREQQESEEDESQEESEEETQPLDEEEPESEEEQEEESEEKTEEMSSQDFQEEESQEESSENTKEESPTANPVEIKVSVGGAETSQEGLLSGEETGGGDGEAGGSADSGSEVGGGTDEGDQGETKGQEGSGESGSGTESQEGIITNLYSHMVTTAELSDDVFFFFAYYSDDSVDANIQVRYRHSTESGNGTLLTASGTDYSQTLSIGTNYFTISYTNSEGQRQSVRYTITYQAVKADANNPVVGNEPPTIETNLDNWTGYITQQQFGFKVKATTASGNAIYASNLVVTMDGTVITSPTGNRTFEYALYFNPPYVGDYEDHYITVLAWDDEGNSRFVAFTVTYESTSEGTEIGTVTVYLDMTTVGLGVWETETYPLIQGQPASYTVVQYLEDMGFTCTYSGTLDNGFYLSRITLTDMFRGATIPQTLYELLVRDGQTIYYQTKPTTMSERDSLGEMDFTRGSGWMYAVNGYYPGRGLSQYYLNDGDVVCLRFTVAWGKDIGGYESTGSSLDGVLSSYCGAWIDGGYVQYEHSYVLTEQVAATGSTDGYVKYVCSKCHAEYTEVIPATGEEETTEPAQTQESEETNSQEESETDSGEPEESSSESENPSEEGDQG